MLVEAGLQAQLDTSSHDHAMVYDKWYGVQVRSNGTWFNKHTSQWHFTQVAKRFKVTRTGLERCCAVDVFMAFLVILTPLSGPEIWRQLQSAFAAACTRTAMDE